MAMKLSGNTLIEVLTALGLLSLVFALGIGIFQQIAGISSPTQRHKSRVLMKEFLDAPLPFPFVRKEEKEIKGRQMVREIILIHPGKRLCQLTVSCFWKNELVERRSRIIQAPPDYDSGIFSPLSLKP